MKKFNQEKNLLIELIVNEINRRGWKPVHLSKKSNVPQPVISRLLNYSKNVKIEHIYNILKCLNLLNLSFQHHEPTLSIQITKTLQTFHQDFAYDNYIPVRLIHDKVAAGTPTQITESDVDGYCLIYADKEWMPNSPENYTCCRVIGDSMSRILESGDIVAIDHTPVDIKSLDGEIVAFKVDNGVTIKWLQLLKNGDAVGVPENINCMNEIVHVSIKDIDKNIIGKVAWWWSKRRNNKPRRKER